MTAPDPEPTTSSVSPRPDPVVALLERVQGRADALRGKVPILRAQAEYADQLAIELPRKLLQSIEVEFTTRELEQRVAAALHRSIARGLEGEAMFVHAVAGLLREQAIRSGKFVQGFAEDLHQDAHGHEQRANENHTFRAELEELAVALAPLEPEVDQDELDPAGGDEGSVVSSGRESEALAGGAGGSDDLPPVLGDDGVELPPTDPPPAPAAAAASEDTAAGVGGET